MYGYEQVELSEGEQSQSSERATGNLQSMGIGLLCLKTEDLQVVASLTCV